MPPKSKVFQLRIALTGTRPPIWRRVLVPSTITDPWGNEARDTRKCRLNQVLSTPKQWMKYMYDFGDSREHKITLQKILPADTKKKLPFCLSGKLRVPRR